MPGLTWPSPQAAADGVKGAEMPDTRTASRTRRSLKPLDLARLVVGQALPVSVLCKSGRVLLRAGHVLRHEDLERIQRRVADGIFAGSEWTEASDSLRRGGVDCGVVHDVDTMQTAETVPSSTQSPVKPGNKSNFVSVTVDSLQAGMQLDCALYSSRGALLLPAGVEITYRLLGRLRRYNIFEVHLRESACPPNAGVSTERADAEQDATTSEQSSSLDAKVRRNLRNGKAKAPRPKLSLDNLRAETQRAREVYSEAVPKVESVLLDVFRGRRSSPQALKKVLSKFVDLTQLDDSLLAATVSFGDASEEYLFQHGLNVALMSIAAATEMAVSEEDVVTIGLGALMQDVGMLRIPDALRFAPRALTENERLEIKRHPIYSVDLLERIGIEETSLAIAYQSHERPDRSGYPKGRHGMLIHPYARIVAAADAYVALSSNRPHRPGCSPYRAMETLLQEANRDRFDRNAIRILLDCVSLFPIGSYVRLSDGRIAKVLRANPGLHTKPVVVGLHPDGSESDTELDLARDGSVRITQALSGKPDPHP